MYELQYADDAALPSHSPSDLQENLNTLADAYHRAGLIINTKKTEILSPIQHSFPSSQLSFTVHGDILNRTPTVAVYFHLILIWPTRSNSGLNSRHQLLVDWPIACSSTATKCLRKWQSRKQSACPLCYTDVKAGFHIDDTSRRWKPMSAASKVSSAFVGDTGRHIQKYVTLLKSNPLSSYYYKDNLCGWATSYVCHPTVFHVVYSMANCNSDKDQLADQSCVTLTTSSPCSGNATFQNLS